MPLPALLLAAGLQTASPPPSGIPNTPVSGITVTATNGEAPHLVSSWPAQGAAVASGTLVVKLTFDQKMSPTAFSYAAVPGQGLPRCMERPRLLNDGKTFVVLCVTTEKGSWGLRLNGAGPEGAGPGFAAAGGKPLAPLDLTFTTTDDTPVASMADAMKAASLEDDQGPVVNQTAQALTPASAVTATPVAPPA